MYLHCSGSDLHKELISSEVSGRTLHAAIRTITNDIHPDSHMVVERFHGYSTRGSGDVFAEALVFSLLEYCQGIECISCRQRLLSSTTKGICQPSYPESKSDCCSSSACSPCP